MHVGPGYGQGGELEEEALKYEQAPLGGLSLSLFLSCTRVSSGIIKRQNYFSKRDYISFCLASEEEAYHHFFFLFLDEYV